MAIGNAAYDQDDGAVTLATTADISGDSVAVISGIVGIAQQDSESGDTVALALRGAYIIEIPDSLSAAVGNTLFVDITNLTGHTPDSDAYYLASGSNRVELLKIYKVYSGSAWAGASGTIGVAGLLLPKGQ